MADSLAIRRAQIAHLIQAPKIKPAYQWVPPKERRQKVKDMTGQRSGKLLVTGRHGNDHRDAATWNCVCDCGNSCVETGINLRRGTTGKPRKTPYACPACRKADAKIRRRGVGGPKNGRPPLPQKARAKVCKVCWGTGRGFEGDCCPKCGAKSEGAAA